MRNFAKNKMGEQQAGLCLSCGVPFLPDVSKIQFFNREGVMSILFLNTEYLENRDIQEMFYHPRFTSQRNQAHMFHESHHATAIDYMCNRHNDDDDVGQGFVPAPGAVVPNQNSAPFLYYRAPTSKTRKDARAGVWPKPAQDQRLNFKRLRRYIQESAGLPSCEALNHNLKQMYSTCRSCNALMTQQADIRFLLGYSPAGTKNDLGPVISQSHINEYPVDAHREPLERGYNSWSIKNPIPAFVGPHPVQDRNDSDAAHVAYYLHMCLPFQAPGANNFFVTHFADPNLRHSARSLYIEQSWIALEIAAIATLIEQGKVAADDPKRSHGMHQHYGILDLYVSYFMFRLIQFRFGRNLRRNGLNFVQWHQKYFCEALDCMDLYEPKENRGILGQRMYGTTYQDSKKLIVQICNRIVKELTTKLDPLVQLVTSRPNVPHGISEFFVPVEVLTVLRDRSRQVCAFF